MWASAPTNADFTLTICRGRCPHRPAFYVNIRFFDRLWNAEGGVPYRLMFLINLYRDTHWWADNIRPYKSTASHQIAHNSANCQRIFLRRKIKMKQENRRETEHFKEKTRENRVYIKKIPKKVLTSFGI
jgi:hypothetical protein